MAGLLPTPPHNSSSPRALLHNVEFKGRLDAERSVFFVLQKEPHVECFPHFDKMSANSLGTGFLGKGYPLADLCLQNIHNCRVSALPSRTGVRVRQRPGLRTSCREEQRITRGKTEFLVGVPVEDIHHAAMGCLVF